MTTFLACVWACRVPLLVIAGVVLALAVAEWLLVEREQTPAPRPTPPPHTPIGRRPNQ